MSDPAPLEPVDTEQCQCEEKTYNPFIMGGSCYEVIRCEDKPAVVVTEKEEDEHGQAGAMSLCTKHLMKFVEKKGADVMEYRLESIECWNDIQDKEKKLAAIRI